MATRAARINGPDEQGRVQVVWEGLFMGDDGAPVQLSQLPDKTAQAVGTFSGGSIVLEGGNVDGTWFTLTDPTGVLVSMAADTEGFVLTQNPRYIRPLVSGGDGSTDLTVLIEAYIPRG